MTRRSGLGKGLSSLIPPSQERPASATLAEVSPEWLEGFFASPWPVREHPLADLGA